MSICSGQAFPSILRITPAVFTASSCFPAATATSVPGLRFRRSVSVSLQVPRNFATPPASSPFSSILNQYGLKPACTSTSEQSLSICLRVSSQPDTATAFTTFPGANGANSVFFTRSEMSSTIRSIRRSGLSEPYFSIASRYGILRKGAAEAIL